MMSEVVVGGILVEDRGFRSWPMYLGKLDGCAWRENHRTKRAQRS
jgi:hypothetical protein